MDISNLVETTSADHDLLWLSLAALVLCLLALLFFISSLRTLMRGRFVGSGKRLFVAALFTIGGGALLLVLSNLYVYQQLTHEQQVAVVRFERVSTRHYRMVLEEPERKVREFDLSGDEWQLDARILKWKGPLQLAGFRNRYRLERVQGRYRDVRMEKRGRRSVYGLAGEQGFDLWRWMSGQPEWLAWVDSYYGSSAYLPMADGAQYEVVVTTSGLLARAGNAVARKAVEAW